MSFKNLILEFQGATAVVTLNRPTKRNALSLELMEEFIGLLAVIGAGCRRALPDSGCCGQGLLCRP